MGLRMLRVKQSTMQMLHNLTPHVSEGFYHFMGCERKCRENGNFRQKHCRYQQLHGFGYVIFIRDCGKESFPE